MLGYLQLVQPASPATRATDARGGLEHHRLGGNGVPDRSRGRIREEAGDVFPEPQLEAGGNGDPRRTCRRGDEPVGLITVGRKLSREAFDDENEVFLEAVAGQFAIGLGRLRGRRAGLEFTQALQIQRSLLPDAACNAGLLGRHRLPGVTRSARSAEAIGGQ